MIESFKNIKSRMGLKKNNKLIQKRHIFQKKILCLAHDGSIY